MRPSISTGVRLLLPVALTTLLIPLGIETSGPWAARPAVAAPADPATEDILIMTDGRELHGQILEEKSDAIVFKLVDRSSNISTRITYLLDEIAEIRRDVALVPAAEPEAPARKAATEDDEDAPERTYGAYRASSEREDVPSFYIVPMKGQMGTDIHTDIYREMVDDIRAKDPDILIIEMECRDTEDLLYSMIGREEVGLADFDEFRDLINLFRDDLGSIRQVLWVKDSVGVSSAVALVWDELYMTPDARLAGLIQANLQTGFESWSDDDVRGKMTAAFMSWVKGFLEYGGYSLVLADAMVRPKFSLSGTWKGREVIWTLDTEGDYIVDSSSERTANFRAKSAEDLCISDGTAENLDDLALLLGFREYRLLDSEAEDIFKNYCEDWRRMLENCKTWYQDYGQFMGWANGEDTLKYLGQAKGRLERILGAMKKYRAVETRLAMELGLRRFDLETTLEVMKERIRSLRGNGRGVGGGGAAPPGGRPGAPGRGR